MMRTPADAQLSRIVVPMSNEIGFIEECLDVLRSAGLSEPTA